MKKISRRKVLGGGAAVLAGAAFVEYESFKGHFDHRKSPGVSARERYAKSRGFIASGTEGIVHIGHSTHLISLGGTTILTDPWFYDPAFGALSHAVKPAVLPSEVGPLSIILITHDHADHADLRAMAEMDKEAAVIVATEELAKKVRALGFDEVSVLGVEATKNFGLLNITAVEAVHDCYEVGFVIRREEWGRPASTVYFAGDTAMNPAIAKIGERYRPQVSILPCDGTRLTGSAQLVMTPADAVEAARLLGSRLVIPSHAEAYFSDPIAEHVLASAPPRARETFAAGVAKDLAGKTKCFVPEPGELLAL